MHRGRLCAPQLIKHTRRAAARHDVTRLLVRLANAVVRGPSARELACYVGATSALVFIRDPDLDVLIPAPGFPKTVPGGPEWRDLLRRSLVPGIHFGEVPSAVAQEGATTQELAVACVSDDGTALVLLGCEHAGPRVAALRRALPILTPTLRAEQRACQLAGELVVASDAAVEARAMSDALDAIRADLERALGEAERRAQELQDIDRRRSEFLAMLGHELRNPLSPITAALHLIPIRIQRGQGFEHELAVIGRQIKQLVRLVDDLLDISRITSGRIELRPEQSSLAALISQAVEAVRPLVERRRHKLSVVLPEQPVILHVDPTRIVQVLENILNNAAKYTDPGGEIEVRTERHDRDIAIRIKDTGVGIPADVLPRIFDIFVQGPRTIDRAQGGLGLGLALVRTLVKLHGGSVDAQSAGAGRGSEFVVHLPLPRKDEAMREERATQDVTVTPSEVELPVAQPRVSPLRILVVDDNQDANATVEDMLKLWGYDVVVAFDGEQAVQAARRYRPQAIVLDIGLPRMSGYDVARVVRQELPEVRLIALSGYGNASDRAASKAAGFDCHLVKPVEPGVLRGALQYVATL